MAVVREERSLGDLFGELSEGTSILIQQEIRLAKAEISQKLSKAGKNAGFIAGGGIIALVGFVALIGAAIAALALVMPVWAAALIVGIVVIGIGYGLIQKGLGELKELNPAPKKTIESLKEDREWLKQQVA